MPPALLLGTVIASVLSPFKVTSTLRPIYAKHAAGRRMALSAQTIAEMWLWAELSNWGDARRADLDAYLATYVQLSCDMKLAPAWAKVTGFSRAVGKPLASGDAWIAATALEYGLELLTHDKDFVGLKIPGLAVTCFA